MYFKLCDISPSSATLVTVLSTAASCWVQMARYGVWMLEKLVLRYSESGGSSRGMRAFVEQALPELRASNPQIAVESVGEKSMFHHPYLLAQYKNGRSKEVCVKNLQPDAIAEHIYWLRNSMGRSEKERVIASRHLSRQPSIQGMWTVKTFEQQLWQLNDRRQTAAASVMAAAGVTTPAAMKGRSEGRLRSGS